MLFSSQIEACTGMNFVDMNAVLQSFPPPLKSEVLTLSTNRKLTSEIKTVFKMGFCVKSLEKGAIKVLQTAF